MRASLYGASVPAFDNSCSRLRNSFSFCRLTAMRLPLTSVSRRDRGFLRLLTDVDVYAPPGLQFRGRLLTPGAALDVCQLPRPAVLIEYAGRVRVGKVTNSRHSFAAQWLLWRFDFDAGAWVEVIRSVSADAAWSVDFAPVALGLLDAERMIDTSADLARPECERVTDRLSVELDSTTREMRCHVLAALDQYIATEIVRNSIRPLDLRKKAA